MRASLALFLVGVSTAAPYACGPESICISPSTNETVQFRRNGAHLEVSYNVRELRIYQEKNTKIQTNLECNPGESCTASVPLDRYNPSIPLMIRSGSNEPVSLNLETLSGASGLTKQQRRQFSKAHAILMLLGWLFFVPTGFLFARMGRDLFKEQTLFGSAVWFQIHRAANFVGVVCILTSILCIFISQQWTWKGSFSGAKYWTAVHTDLGIISTVLAVAQPLNSLLRCGPTHSRRVYFNWIHRCIGIVSFTLALTAIIIAAVQFKKIWNEPLLEVVLTCLPVAFCIAGSIGFVWLENTKFRAKGSFEPHLLRIPVIFLSVGIFFTCAVALSLLVVNGYKNV
ncbi:unnamed protein product [Caenorhabditis bovis]|uniref:Cytochrome b561 domain-containing protein n=1 Tax=Caenorhabditis bovis TaxID=2654633 RepID=A0A8S1FF07_9PELO|nr:unnamed protein product [Caenorhabditis bovis]